MGRGSDATLIGESWIKEDVDFTRQCWRGASSLHPLLHLVAVFYGLTTGWRRFGEF